MAETSLPQYTLVLLHEIKRIRLGIRGRDGLADQSGIAASRFEEISHGDRPNHQEHKKICRALPRMRHYQTLLLEWEKMANATAMRAEKTAAQANGRAFGFEPAPAPKPTSSLPAAMIDTAIKLVDNLAAKQLPAPPPPPPPAPAPQPAPAPTPAPKPPDDERSFGALLRLYRRASGRKVPALAVELGVSRTLYYEWEVDDAMPSAAYLVKLSKAFPGLITPAPKSESEPEPEPEPEPKKTKRKIEWRSPQKTITFASQKDDDPLEVELEEPKPPARTVESFRILVASTKRMLKSKRLDETVRDLLRGAEETGLTLTELIEIFRATKVSS